MTTSALFRFCAGLGIALSGAVAHAQYGDAPAAGGTPTGAGTAALNVVDESNRPLFDGSYVAILPQYRISQDDDVLDEGVGVNALIGYRNRSYGFETGFTYGSEDGVKLISFLVNALWYPFDSVPMLYGVIGGGATRYQDYPFERSPRPVEGNDGFVTANIQGGLGYVVPLSWGNYEYGVRIEALYRVSDRFIERESDFITDIAAPDTFKDVLINIGLHLPLRKLPPPPPAPEPVAVVEPAPPADSDGDGVSDDRDRCPNTPAGVRVDANGCEPPPPPPPCKAPESGERVSLEGCGTGDVLVLRGVNFDFDSARLTPNAKTLLDSVAAELLVYRDIEIEIGGHTDSRGSDEYNQRLSAERAEAVRDYLEAAGVDAARVSAQGYGERNSIADNGTEAGRELNRRVELSITGGRAVRDPAEISSDERMINSEPEVGTPSSPEPVPEATDARASDIEELLAY